MVVIVCEAIRRQRREVGGHNAICQDVDHRDHRHEELLSLTMVMTTLDQGQQTVPPPPLLKVCQFDPRKISLHLKPLYDGDWRFCIH